MNSSSVNSQNKKDTTKKNKDQFLVICENLEKVYGSKNLRVQALKNINLRIKKGECLAIIGASGSGKTTLLNLLGGLDKPTSGKIIFDNQNIADYGEEEQTEHRQNIGFIFQNYNLHPVLTAKQNIELPLIYYSGEKIISRKMRVNSLLEMVGLSDRADHLPVELSSGEKQRVGIARALANNPKLLLADQPTGNLDSEIGEKIINLLISLQKDLGKTMCLVTHNIDVAKKADRIFLIKDGVIQPYSIT
ncbi:MAG: ABC transporter ATP-binding protein [Asgard group archaeon]|nr:ABC transporter ATP-binding protein [Asgard group archaeon]